MPFRRRFDCLWCGRTWGTRSDDDLEGWAALCPDCLAKADDNGFLRGRVRTALRDRSAAAERAPGPPGDWEDWYLRRGRYARGPIHDGPWTMELDEVTRWVDGLTLGGVIVELGAGMGWWTGLLAEKGELWVYDSDGASLDAARTRLMAHGLLAHLHQRDPLATPDKQVDAVFAASDSMAIAAMQAVKESGRRVPEDVAVIGFDNQEVIAAHLRPPLTTVELPHYDMGYRALSRLLALIHEEEDGGTEAVECPLVERDSV